MTLEIRELSPCLKHIAQHSCMILAMANVWPWGPSRVSPDPEAKKSTTFVPLLSAICNKVQAPNSSIDTADFTGLLLHAFAMAHTVCMAKSIRDRSDILTLVMQCSPRAGTSAGACWSLMKRKRGFPFSRTLCSFLSPLQDSHLRESS